VVSKIPMWGEHTPDRRYHSAKTLRGKGLLGGHIRSGSQDLKVLLRCQGSVEARAGFIQRKRTSRSIPQAGEGLLVHLAARVNGADSGFRKPRGRRWPQQFSRGGGSDAGEPRAPGRS
jgi:hypothetical protein